MLRDRLMENLPNSQAETAGGFEVNGETLATGSVRAWLDAHAQSGVVGVDFTGQWRAGAGDLTGIALAASDGKAAWIEVTELSPDDDAALAAWLADPSLPKAVHYAKGPLLALWSRGWELAGLASDTQLAAYLLRPDQRVYDLADLAARYLNRELSGTAAADDTQAAFDFDDSSSSDAMVRARSVIDLAQELESQLADQGGTSLLQEVELPLTRTLAAMERVGSLLTWTGWSGCAPTSTSRCPRPRALPSRRSATRSTSVHPSSCRWPCSMSWECPRPGAPRPGTPPTQSRWSTSTPPPSTRSWPTCCVIATRSGSARPSRDC